MIVFGVVNAICSIIFGTLMKYTGRFVIIIFGTVIHMAIFTYLLFWRPHPDHIFVFFLISGLWGVSDAVWQTQINGLYGALFRRNKEAAFSNYRLWESLGFVIAYAYSTAICAKMKLYIVISVLALGTICYIIVEIRQLRKVKKLIFKNSNIKKPLNNRIASKKNSRRSSNSRQLRQCLWSRASTSKTKLMMKKTSWKKTSLSLICKIIS